MAFKKEKFFSLKKWILRANGLFLSIIGLVQLIFIFLAYQFQLGPLSISLSHYPLLTIITFSEAFFLAFIIGVIFLFVSNIKNQFLWHYLAILIHGFFFVMNISFWSVFSEINMVQAAIFVTICHLLFILSHGFIIYIYSYSNR